MASAGSTLRAWLGRMGDQTSDCLHTLRSDSNQNLRMLVLGSGNGNG